MLIDVVSGEISPVEWKKGTNDTLESVPVRASVLAIADERYFDWAVLPEAPSSLSVTAAGDSAQSSWEVHGGNPTGVVVERRLGDEGRWEQAAKLGANSTEYSDSKLVKGQRASYRVRAVSGAGESAYSNVASTSFH